MLFVARAAAEQSREQRVSPGQEVDVDDKKGVDIPP